MREWTVTIESEPVGIHENVLETALEELLACLEGHDAVLGPAVSAREGSFGATFTLSAASAGDASATGCSAFADCLRDAGARPVPEVRAITVEVAAAETPAEAA